MKKDIDLNVLEALSAKRGKQGWLLNQSGTEEGESGKQMHLLPMYTEGEGKKGYFL